MKLSNQNICNLQGCQMPFWGGGGVQIISGGANHFWGCAPPLPPPPRKSVPENTNCKNCVNKSIKVSKV